MGAARKHTRSKQYAEILIERGGDEYLVDVEGTVEEDGAVEDLYVVGTAWSPAVIRLTDEEQRFAAEALVEAAS